MAEKIGFELVVAFRQTIAVYWATNGVFRLFAGNRECQTGGPPTHFPVMPAKTLLPIQESRIRGRSAILSVGHVGPLCCSFLRWLVVPCPNGSGILRSGCRVSFRHCLVATRSSACPPLGVFWPLNLSRGAILHFSLGNRGTT
jgi:hypothetical protein